MNEPNNIKKLMFRLRAIAEFERKNGRCIHADDIAEAAETISCLNFIVHEETNGMTEFDSMEAHTTWKNLNREQ